MLSFYDIQHFSSKSHVTGLAYEQVMLIYYILIHLFGLAGVIRLRSVPIALSELWSIPVVCQEAIMLLMWEGSEARVRIWKALALHGTMQAMLISVGFLWMKFFKVMPISYSTKEWRTETRVWPIFWTIKKNGRSSQNTQQIVKNEKRSDDTHTDTVGVIIFSTPECRYKLCQRFVSSH